MVHAIDLWVCGGMLESVHHQLQRGFCGDSFVAGVRCLRISLRHPLVPIDTFSVGDSVEALGLVLGLSFVWMQRDDRCIFPFYAHRWLDRSFKVCCWPRIIPQVHRPLFRRLNVRSMPVILV